MTPGDRIHLPRGNRNFHPVGFVDLVDGDLVRVADGPGPSGKRRWYARAQIEEAEHEHAAAVDAKREKKQPKLRRPMTTDEKRLVRKLARCSMGSHQDKRFVGEMVALARNEEAQITDGQGRYIAALAHKYREQLAWGSRGTG